MSSITVNGSCPNPLFMPREGFCFYVNPTLGTTFDDAASVCQGYADGYNLASISVIVFLEMKYFFPT